MPLDSYSVYISCNYLLLQVCLFLPKVTGCAFSWFSCTAFLPRALLWALNCLSAFPQICCTTCSSPAPACSQGLNSFSSQKHITGELFFLLNCFHSFWDTPRRLIKPERTMLGSASPGPGSTSTQHRSVVRGHPYSHRKE